MLEKESLGRERMIFEIESLSKRALRHNPNDSLLGQADETVVARNLREAILNEDNIVTTVKNTHGTIVGFSLATDISLFDPDRIAEKGETAYLYYIAIDAQYRRKGLLGKLSDKFIKQMQEKGYAYFEVDARRFVQHATKGISPDSYAAKLARHFGAHEAIMDSGHHNIWGIGPQTFYRIDIEKYQQDRAQSIT